MRTRTLTGTAITLTGAGVAISATGCSGMAKGGSGDVLTGMLAGMARTAREEGFAEIADWFETLAKAERSHAGRFQKALNAAAPQKTEPLGSRRRGPPAPSAAAHES